MEYFGQQLRQEREQRGLALEAMAAETRVQTRHLLALEEEEYGSLPGGVFRRGIVRAYLGFLRLDEAEWMPRFEQSFSAYAHLHHLPAENDGGKWQEFAENVKRGRSPAAQSHSLRWAGLVFLLLLVLAAAAYTWVVLLHGHLRR